MPTIHALPTPRPPIAPDSPTAVAAFIDFFSIGPIDHDLDNLHVVDASFFPSCGAVNPSLTIVANAIRGADHLLTDRLT
jgi:hypothetical protein